MRPLYTNQKQLREAFWRLFPNLTRKPGRQNKQVHDTRFAWCDWINMLEHEGDISEALAFRATL